MFVFQTSQQLREITAVVNLGRGHSNVRLKGRMNRTMFLLSLGWMLFSVILTDLPPTFLFCFFFLSFFHPHLSKYISVTFTDKEQLVIHYL